MGVSKENFVIFGYKGPYEKFICQEDVDGEDTSDLEYVLNVPSQYEAKQDELFILSDGMSGQYSIFGLLVKRFGDERFYYDEDLDIEVSISELQELEKKLKEKMSRLNVDFSNLPEPKLIGISHYS